MISLQVRTEPPYPVLIGSGLLPAAGALIREHLPAFAGAHTAVITDSTVNELYGDTAVHSLENAGFRVSRCVFPAGEQNKNIAEYAKILSFLAEEKITRGDFLITLGGGVAGDMGGFAAATYLRGIPFVQIPTTFLAAADASVGGKTAVDLPAGKNLAGAFHQPSMVIIDPALFATLSETAFQDGLTESLKHGLIADADFFRRLAESGRGCDLENAVRRDVEIKSIFVAEDPLDKGRRMMLNFGHTIGHAIEKNSNYRLSHGQSVAIGMCMAQKAAVSFGITEYTEKPIEEALARCGICSRLSSLAFSEDTDAAFSPDCFSTEALAKAALGDKKRFGGTVNIIYLKNAGEAAVHPLPAEDLPAFIEAGRA